MRHIDEEFAARSMFGGLTASGERHGWVPSSIAKPTERAVIQSVARPERQHTKGY